MHEIKWGTASEEGIINKSGAHVEAKTTARYEQS
jgi:hypothetical protein